MPLSQDRLSTFEVLIPVQVLIPEGANPDTGDDVVQYQFVLGGLPVRNRPTESSNLPTSTGWLDGYWVTTASGGLLAAILVGPDGGVIALPPGAYAIWLRVVDNPTVPVAPVDVLVVT